MVALYRLHTRGQGYFGRFNFDNAVTKQKRVEKKVENIENLESVLHNNNMAIFDDKHIDVTTTTTTNTRLIKINQPRNISEN